MSRIDRALLRKAIHLLANNKPCAEDSVVSEMLRVLDEDVLDMLAVAIETRVLNREGEKDGALTMEDCGSIFVQYPYGEKIDRRDGIVNRRMKSTVHVEDGMVMSFAEEEPDVACSCRNLSGSAATDGPADLAWQPLQHALWKSHEVSLLARVPNAKLLKDFRPNAVLLVIYKLYSRVMYMLTETTYDRLVSAQFAFRKFHHARGGVHHQANGGGGRRVDGAPGVHHGWKHQEGL